MVKVIGVLSVAAVMTACGGGASSCTCTQTNGEVVTVGSDAGSCDMAETHPELYKSCFDNSGNIIGPGGGVIARMVRDGRFMPERPVFVFEDFVPKPVAVPEWGTLPIRD